MAAPDITVQDFIKDEQETLTRFREYWDQQHKENPEQFPEKLPMGEWFEQYVAFCEGS